MDAGLIMLTLALGAWGLLRLLLVRRRISRSDETPVELPPSTRRWLAVGSAETAPALLAVCALCAERNSPCPHRSADLLEREGYARIDPGTQDPQRFSVWRGSGLLVIIAPQWADAPIVVRPDDAPIA